MAAVVVALTLVAAHLAGNNGSVQSPEMRKYTMKGSWFNADFKNQNRIDLRINGRRAGGSVGYSPSGGTEHTYSVPAGSELTVTVTASALAVAPTGIEDLIQSCFILLPNESETTPTLPPNAARRVVDNDQGPLTCSRTA
ncbi:MAG TPA: hypothetical protein VMT30_03290 [Candidatus Saccharimonadia bacterium]|nr:hypothetical protein [Candidatus Saccharimonadia bacterium]